MAHIDVNNRNAIDLHAREHDIIEVKSFFSVQEYVLHLMHQSDYERASKLVKGKFVLDLGCNCGYGTNHLSKNCKKIVGVDVSPMAIKAAKSNYLSDNMLFQLVDGISLPFEDNSFDVVTSFQVIEHIVDYDAYFNEIRRVLRREGVLLLTTPNAEIRVNAGQTPWNRFHVHEFRGKELGKFLFGYFPYVQVFGQFAIDHTYLIEYDRCIKARDSVFAPSKSGLRGIAINALPASVAHALRSAFKKLSARKNTLLSEPEKGEFSLDDFYYRLADLDSSLSLVACCSFSETAQIEAGKAFINNNNHVPAQS